MPEGADERRQNYPHFLSIPTRWNDNDVYGHVNNARYYEYFDTVVDQYLITVGGLNIHEGPAINVAAETLCRYHSSLAFPDIVDAGLRVGRLGTSSVRFEIGLFRAGDEAPAATGYFVHVFVLRDSQKPTPIPAQIRAALERLAR
jgi:acyl-CoA thioester hydrolase